MYRHPLRISYVVFLAAFLAGCGIKPVQFAGTPEQRCSAIRTRVSIDPPPVVNKDAVLALDALSAIEERDELARDIVAAYRQDAAKTKTSAPGDREAPVSNAMLFLSGGSQNGAFGAGLLSTWAKEREASGRPGGLPRFRVVTGISTGALQSTFAFLDEPEKIVERYSIKHEGELLHPFTKGGLKGGSTFQKFSAATKLMRKGSLAELEPLRKQLRSLIDHTLLMRVAEQSKANRFLLVGAVEMDSGDAYAFDLTKAASLYANNNDAAMRDCYIEALIASSSVPMAALPVFIDGRMYIDGGARFGVLSDHMGAIFEAAAPHIPDDQPKNLFMIINGTLEADKLCHLRECDMDANTLTHASAVPEHPEWTFDGLAFRSLSILINQAYRSSYYWSTEEAKKRGFQPWMARIDQDDLAKYEAVVGLPPEPTQKHSCDYWKAQDKKIDSPLEFHPRFMRCEIAYGASREEAKEWAAQE